MPIRDDLTAWRLFLTAARTGSLSRTAMLCDTTADKVSRTITALEAEFGFKLLDRHRRPLRPTEKGCGLIEAINPLLIGFDRAWEAFSETHGPKLIRFAAPIDLSRLFFSELLARYSETHPEIRFNVLPEVTPDAVRNDLADAAIINFLPEDTTGLVLRPYNTSSTPLLATPEYLATHGAPAQPEDLIKHTGLLLETAMHPGTQRLYQNGRTSGVLQWKNVFITHDQMTLRQLLLEHRGITIDLYAGHMLPEIKSGRVVPIMPGWRREPWQMSIITRWEAEKRSSDLANFALYVQKEAGAVWQPVRREADAAVAEAFRRHMEISS